MDVFVVVAYFIVLALIIAVPLAIGYWLSKKLKISWKAFIIAAVFFFVVQIFHTPFVIFTQSPIFNALSVLQNQVLEVAIFAVILGLLAGLFEEIGRYLIMRYYFRKKTFAKNKENALMFGLGWGWGECIFVGVLVLSAVIGYVTVVDWTPQNIADVNIATGGQLNDVQVKQIEAQVAAYQKLAPVDVFAGLFERMMTIVLQISFTMLVFKAIIANRKSLLVLAILFHTVVDAVAVFSGQFNGIWLTELCIFAFAVIAIVYIYMQFKKK